MNPIVNSAAVATYEKLPKRTQHITIFIAGLVMAVYGAYRLAKVNLSHDLS